MKLVAQSEHDLLTVTRALLGMLDVDAAAPLVRQGRTLAPRLGPTAMGLLKETMAKGAILALCRRGGWAASEQLSGAEVRSGRIWERRAAPALEFTLTSLELCRWLTAAPLVSAAPPRLKLAGARVSAADELALYLACELLAACGCSSVLVDDPAFRSSVLCWLGFADLLAAGGPPSDRELPAAAFERLFEEPRALLLEALQTDLERRWLEMERGKGRLPSTERLLKVGQAQRAVLERLTGAAEAAGRRDLCGFLWRAGGRLLRHRPAPEQWLGALSPEVSLEERSRACREGAGAFLRELCRREAWVEEARSRRFFDDDYPAAQLLLRQWEELGVAGSQEARSLVDAFEALDAPLRVAGAADAVSEPAPRRRSRTTRDPARHEP